MFSYDFRSCYNHKQIADVHHIPWVLWAVASLSHHHMFRAVVLLIGYWRSTTHKGVVWCWTTTADMLRWVVLARAAPILTYKCRETVHRCWWCCDGGGHSAFCIWMRSWKDKMWFNIIKCSLVKSMVVCTKSCDILTRLFFHYDTQQCNYSNDSSFVILAFTFDYILFLDGINHH